MLGLSRRLVTPRDYTTLSSQADILTPCSNLNFHILDLRDEVECQTRERSLFSCTLHKYLTISGGLTPASGDIIPAPLNSALISPSNTRQALSIP